MAYFDEALKKQARGSQILEQPIVGFHLDSENDWVAELACGHDQHVRHNPPWTNRPWVVTAQGRTSKLGASLDCRKCDIGLPPDRTLMSSELLPGGCRASAAQQDMNRDD